MKLIKGIGKGLKGIVSGGGIKDLIPLANGITEDIKDIKTDPVKRWEKLGGLAVKLIITLGVLYLIGKGVISVDEANELL